MTTIDHDDDDETAAFHSGVPSDFSSEDDYSDSTTRNKNAGNGFSDLDDEETYVLSDAVARSLASSERLPSELPSREGTSRESTSREGSLRDNPSPSRQRKAQMLSTSGKRETTLPPRIGEDGEEEDTVNMAVPMELLLGLPRPKSSTPKPTRPLPRRPSLVDEVTPAPVATRVRPLASLPPPDLDMNDQTMSSPNIVRMSFQASEAKRRADAAAHAAAEPTSSGLDEEGSLPTLESAEAYDGRLVVVAPDDATVFVDGVERGRGEIVVDELDRYTHYIIRIHRPKYRPWSTSVTLRGKAEVRVVPDLIPR